MAARISLLLGFTACLLLGLFTPTTKPALADDDIPDDDFNRLYFPDDFIFGTATSAYQIEGEANKKCRGPSIWDTFTHDFSERIVNGSNGNEAVNFYNVYKEDIKRMKEMGFGAFRFSISWSRIIPSGRVHEGVNEQGIEFYNNLIDEIINNGMEPYATIFHWDTPQALEDKYGGFLSSEIVDDFHDFADLCFKNFGDRVKYWVTINEPWSLASFAYDSGDHAPGRCSDWVNRACPAGNSATEPYIVSHNLLLAHAATVELYRKKYQARQYGKIGITLNSMWFEPYSNSAIDKEAARTALDFIFGWFMDPITYGQYPRSMQTLVGDRLPKFMGNESKLLKGSYDFLGLNYYAANYAKGNAIVDPHFQRYSTDHHVEQTPFDENGKPIGQEAYSRWLYIYPKGIQYLLNYIKREYKDPIIYITENGVDEFNNKTLTLEQALEDRVRKEYYQTHLWNVLRSVNESKVNVKGYFAWSYLDNFEWNIGYTSRFGLIYVDYEDNLRRHLKESATWFEKFLKELIPPPPPPPPPVSTVTDPAIIPHNFNRSFFPHNFTFGTATSAYQIEGEANTKCRGPSTWDTFTHDFPERIVDGSNGNEAVNFYNVYKEDIQRMKEMGFEAFRFSISWSRVIPSGRVREGVNEQGIEFYNNLIDEIIQNGMEPYATIFHWDTPQALEDKYGGFLSSEIVDDFRNFADLCFKKFGGSDRVRYWVTVNEPWSLASFGYDSGVHAPGRCSAWLLLNYIGKSTRQNKRARLETLNSMWFEPYSNSIIDKEAAKTALDFMFGWFMDPITYGQYPRSMQTLVGDRLPKFKRKESKLLKGSYDFLGLNYYAANYAKGNAIVDPHYPRYSTDHHVNQTRETNLQAYSPWFYIYPEGIRHLLNYIKNEYKDPEIYITENGVDELNDKTLTLEQAVEDRVRKEYYQTHLWNVYRSINESKVNVKGYFAWSYLDNFEWNIGYTSRFGLIYVDYEKNLARDLKQSAIWFEEFLQKQ
ncbi:hypothetical protein GH714_003596 [Hevea brasiliensis]|uniref:Beta-glucosidase n=1 Tax=Hevea brasiliensis TaxID=3981 RepID=A0A6A6L086_HEVBR|nr:hypothetical protein GH714_003596 [Hevea brasiliensis]